MTFKYYLKQSSSTNGSDALGSDVEDGADDGHLAGDSQANGDGRIDVTTANMSDHLFNTLHTTSKTNIRETLRPTGGGSLILRARHVTNVRHKAVSLYNQKRLLKN
jgi:hypothetical protein